MMMYDPQTLRNVLQRMATWSADDSLPGQLELCCTVESRSNHTGACARRGGSPVSMDATVTRRWCGLPLPLPNAWATAAPTGATSFEPEVPILAPKHDVGIRNSH